MTLKLNEVTLICFDTRNIEAAIFSMSMSLRRVNFAESILFTSSRLCSEALKSKAAKTKSTETDKATKEKVVKKSAVKKKTAATKDK